MPYICIMNRPGSDSPDDLTLEREVLNEFRRELEGMVTMPWLFRGRFHEWCDMVKGLLEYWQPYPGSDPKLTEEQLYEEHLRNEVVTRYRAIRNSPQHRFDWFVMYQDPRLPPHAGGLEITGSWDIQEWMRRFEVSKEVDSKMRAVHHKRVEAVVEWDRIKG